MIRSTFSSVASKSSLVFSGIAVVALALGGCAGEGVTSERVPRVGGELTGADTAPVVIQPRTDMPTRVAVLETVRAAGHRHASHDTNPTSRDVQLCRTCSK